MTNTLGMTRTDALTAATIGTCVGIVMTPIAGAIADRIGQARVYIFGAAFVFVYAFALFALLDTKNVVTASIAMSIGYGLGFSGLASSQGRFSRTFSRPDIGSQDWLWFER